MLLPVPRLVKDKKTKTWIMEPVNGQEIMNRIVSRWKELGGLDRTICDKILGEVYAPIRSA